MKLAVFLDQTLNVIQIDEWGCNYDFCNYDKGYVCCRKCLENLLHIFPINNQNLLDHEFLNC